MCPERAPASLARQRGFLLPLALFMMVAIGLLALGLWRTASQTNVGAVQEVVSVQAFYAAESGAQTGMSRLFYPDASARQDIDQRCQSLSETENFSAAGLSQCTADFQCQCQYESGAACEPGNDAHYEPGTDNPHSFYRITSEGRCDVGGLSATRIIEVNAHQRQE